MKTLIISGILTFSFCTVMGQQEKLQSGDSMRVALERESISKDLIQLRDSIQVSLKSFETRLKSASPLASMQLTTSKKELLGYQNQVKLDLEEVSQTSQNGWGADSIKRLRTSMTDTRRNHKRICQILKT